MNNEIPVEHVPADPATKPKFLQQMAVMTPDMAFFSYHPFASSHVGIYLRRTPIDFDGDGKPEKDGRRRWVVDQLIGPWGNTKREEKGLEELNTAYADDLNMAQKNAIACLGFAEKVPEFANFWTAEVRVID